MVKEYDKLVRDDIPEIIRKDGKTPVTTRAKGAEYCEMLRRKLDEEVREYHDSQDPEELADILEVVYALAEAEGTAASNIESLRKFKQKDRGGFEEGIILREVRE